MYELRFALDLAKALKKLTPKETERIKAGLRKLAQEPRGTNTKKLKGRSSPKGGSELYRYRVGKYRIIYGIQDDKLIVLVLDVMRRSDDYEGLETLIKRWKSLLE